LHKASSKYLRNPSLTVRVQPSQLRDKTNNNKTKISENTLFEVTQTDEKPSKNYMNLTMFSDNNQNKIKITGYDTERSQDSKNYTIKVNDESLDNNDNSHSALNSNLTFSPNKYHLMDS
jgi:hypothetical protein